MARIRFFLLVIAAIVALVSASCASWRPRPPPTLAIVAILPLTHDDTAAPTFCKCTCFKNSTIIPLGPQHQSSSSLRRSSDLLAEPNLHIPRSASTSCSQCTKSFCLSQGIGFCKDAKEEDVGTMCFQRDSNKDKIIVWGFLIGTVGLLGWAAFKRVVELREARAIGRHDINYEPMTGSR